MRALFIFILAASLFAGCGAPDPKDDAADFQVFSLVDSSASGLNFVNRLDERPDFNIFFFDYFYNGSGVAIGDVNNDGLPDVLLTANTSGNRLFINKGKLVFEDVTEKAGLRQDRWSTGAVMVDINNDGLLDMYICNGGPYEDVGMIKNELYINQGDGTFKEEAEAYGIAGFHRSTQASFFDYDKDGDLDLYVMNYSDLVYRQHDSTEITMTAYPREKFPQNSGALYRNEGNGKFTDVSEQSGIMTPGFGLGLITSDFNGDGLIDIYISNDYLIPNFLFINQGDGTFKDEIKQRLDHCSYFSMGVDYADFNNDGLQDIAEVDMMPEDHVLNKTFMRAMNPDLFFQVKEIGLIPQFMFNALHVQHGYGVYSDIAQIAGAGKTDWSWTSLLGDLDNDGWRDYLVTNGFRRNLKNNDYTVQQLPQISRWMVNEQYDSCWAFLQEYPGYPLVNYLFKNNGDLTFQNVSTQWGFDIPTYSTGAALADLDGDGDLDLIINNIDQPAFLYRNNTSEKTKNNWIRFALTDKKTGRTPLNARIEITRPNGDILMEEYKTVRGYQSAMEPILHFGLGKDPAISSIRVVWPDQSVSYLKDKAVNKLHTIDRGEVQAIKENLATQPDYVFVDYTQTLFDQSFRHKEDDYYDFKKEVLLPYRQSTLGPMITVGDVNGDGAMDFFIGGAKGQAGQLYLMDPNRGFYRAPCQPWTAQAGSEDMGGAFFDFDGDGDLDLYIASGGGGEFAQGDPLLRDRVYLNDGKGCFTGPIAGAVPDVRASSGRVAAADWDGDGDVDLFVAGRTKPGQYPFPGESVLLRNDKGKLADVTDEMAPGLRNIGMVTDAKFADLNGDKRPDLILTGEWMTVKVFIQENGIFTDRSEEWGFGDKTGWWYSVALADVNQDGKMDIITGNIGLNNKFKIKEKNPLHVFANDFDENGVYDIVLSSSYKGNLVPVRGRQCSSEQMPFIKEKFPTYAQFANATLEDIYGEDKLQESLHYEANEARSMVWLNQGKSFSPLPLPNAAQIGPLLSILVVDANKDKYPDLIVGGGLADTEPETAAFDSNKGMLLIGAGDGTFKPVWLKNSGLYLASRNVRDMAMLPVGTSTAQVILVAGNNDFLQSILFDGPRKQ
jgi:enediyne biosynthesis protein E4